MKRHILLLSVLVWTILSATAQGTIQLTVTSATATSTCSDLFSTSNHPSLRLKVNNGDWALYRYPQNPDCEIPLPALQFEESYDCPVDIGRTSFNVCLEVFENDARLNAGSCKITPDNGCTVQLCQDFQLPLPGNTTTYGLSISDSEPSSGSVQFTISMDDNFIGGINDLPCSAIDLGVLEQNTTLGDSNTDAYTNYCATNENEIQSIRTPDGQEIFNSYGVWHKFKTATTDLSKVIITAKSSTIDPIHLQVVLFEAAANCFENPKPLAIAATRATYDERLEVSCDVIQPDTEYLILIDGFNDVLEEYFGYYSLEITGVGASEASDATCTATALGTVPENGAITPTATYSNFCADAQGDPRPTTFSVQQGVLFTFNAPSSGIVQIDVTSDPNSADPIDAEVAIFGARSCAAIASMTEQASTAHAGATTSLTARCLVAGEKYYVLVDGTEQNPEGLFNLQLTDLGAQPIITTIDTTLCSGETVAVGNSNYNSTGQYQTVIPLPSGCDSIVVLNLVVQSPLSLDGDLIENASDENASDGVANVNATGGSGSYSYLWSGGQTTATADNLTAGVDYCVTVTDAIGCTATTCVFIDFVNSIQPDVTTSPLRCNGSDNGQIVISASRGQAPYLYNWQGVSNELSGSGQLNAEDEEGIIGGLPAGMYEITFADMDDSNRDTTLQIEITQPAPITVTTHTNTAASCFSICDAALSITADGGVGNYSYEWSNGAQTSDMLDICAGNYDLTVTDGNGCTLTVQIEVEEPNELIATARQLRPVSCFEGADGQAEISANKAIQRIAWSTGAITPIARDLAAGTYDVTVTDVNNCSTTSSVNITAPDAPLSISIVEVAPITCHAADDGVLRVDASEPAEQLTYEWSHGATSAVANTLPPDNYTVIVTNAYGCSATASATLDAPSEISAMVSANTITCANAPNSGEIYIENVYGGIPPYEYSLDGVVYTSNSTLTNLFDGNYELLLRDQLGCELTYPVEIAGPPVITASVGVDFSAKLGETIQLEVVSDTEHPQINWTLDSFDCQTTDCSRIELQPFETQTYTVTVTDTITQCQAVDEITVSIDKSREIYVPTAFSPNGDGFNDYFNIFGGKDIERIEVFSVYDRNGALVYERKNAMSNNAADGWDGTNQGQLLNAGVYVWMAEVIFIDGWREMYRGEVTIF